MEQRSYTFNIGKYRYGFNGQEQDDEVCGAGNSYTAEFWQYDSRLGRRWNLDPKPRVGVADYVTFVNNPIIYTDVNGDYAIVDDAVIGFFRGLFTKRSNFIRPGGSRIGNAFRNAGKQAANSARIYGGLFRSEKEDGFLRRSAQVLLRLTWEAPQTVIGLIYAQTLNTFWGGKVSKVSNYHGATAVKLKTKQRFGWGFTIGSFIGLNDNSLLKHEFGHTVVSRKQGPFFIPLNVGSLVTVLMGPTVHSNAPWEKWADRSSDKYFIKLQKRVKKRLKRKARRRMKRSHRRQRRKR